MEERLKFIAELERRIKNEIKSELEKRPKREISSVFNAPVYDEDIEKELAPSDVTDTGLPGTKIACDAIDGIPQKLVLAFGKDNIKSVREQELSGKLKIPPVYFADGECLSLREKLGVKEDGIYLLKEDKKTVKRWKEKGKSGSQYTEFLKSCLPDKTMGEDAPQRMRKCSEKWNLAKREKK